MKLLALAVAASGLLLSTAASAGSSERVTDMDYLHAARCKGLATSIPGVVDGKQFDVYMKAANGVRSPYVLNRADSEFDRGKRDGRSDDRRTRNTEELTGACSAYLGDPAHIAKQ